MVEFTISINIMVKFQKNTNVKSNICRYKLGKRNNGIKNYFQGSDYNVWYTSSFRKKGRLLSAYEISIDYIFFGFAFCVS